MTIDNRPEIRAWLEDGKAKGATHMIVMSDSFCYEYYPVYVLPGQNILLVADEHRPDPTKMRDLIEVYSYALPLEPQVDEPRCHHYELAASPSTCTVDLQELSRLAQYAGMLERLLQLPGSLLAHPHWRPAVQHCLAGLQGLYEDPPSAGVPAPHAEGND